MFDTREKKERSLGVKLFLKADRCNSAKCVMAKRPHRPGAHGKSYKSMSEFGQQLKEKQKIRFSYGIRENQMKLIFKKASRNPGITGAMIMNILESRLDNVVYRLGFGASRSVARQLVSHGHIMVNGRRVTIPSLQVAVGNVISLRPQSADHPLFRDLGEKLKKQDVPVWLSLDADKKEGKVVSAPKDFEIPFDVNLVVDFYSK